jgi:NAD/NADP transhydrogenase beta subunit
MDDINHDMPQADVGCWWSAPTTSSTRAARTEMTSPIYGMPIIEATRRAPCSPSSAARTRLRGIDNELYFAIDLDAVRRRQGVIGELVKQLAGGSGMH